MLDVNETKRRVVVTGVNGFVGKHLVNELVENGFVVIGVDRADSIDDELNSQLFNYYSADLTTTWPVKDKVSAVIHLAGLAAVGPSFEAPQDYINLNSAMLTNIAENYLKSNLKPRILVVSSGAIYEPDQPMPLLEDSKIAFTSPYTVSKVLLENLCAYYRTRGLDCVVARPFNHIGPGQKPGFLLPDLYEQLKDKETKTINVGNLKTKRDYTDVRDVVKAYRLIVETDKLSRSIYNICSGKSISGEELLAKLLDITDRKDIEIKVDSKKIRPTDPIDIYGSAQALFGDTGWQPKISLSETITDFVNNA